MIQSSQTLEAEALVLLGNLPPCIVNSSQELTTTAQRDTPKGLRTSPSLLSPL